MASSIGQAEQFPAGGVEGERLGKSDHLEGAHSDADGLVGQIAPTGLDQGGGERRLAGTGPTGEHHDTAVGVDHRAGVKHEQPLRAGSKDVEGGG